MKHLLFVVTLLFLFVGCSETEKALEKEPDFQGMIHYEDELNSLFFVYVDDDLTPREKQDFYIPDYIYGYWVELTNSTILLNDEGEEITIGEAESGNVRVWVEGNFKETRTAINSDRKTFFEMMKEQKGFPYYKAEQVTFFTVELTRDDVIANLKSYDNGKYTVHGYFESSRTYEENIDHVHKLMALMDDLEEIETGSVNIGGSNLPSGAKELGIEEYPFYIIFDTEEIVLETSSIEEVYKFFD
ncbi:hypothetical protein [Halalkalibacter alkaliphilus]|uniref:Uncharacterized protein n=1 Tax=Halalkalibacter alkaliphilus TaxID=2917993 RepID=A0A9X2A5N3_9BACI|nr:hypothetical protein [Halalkalibacter alkaliphilus]MCL7745651.1 hypothetical protein [Halalkalibacter alkaliphilus]